MSYGVVYKILNLAARLEPNRSALYEWICHTQIEVLGGQTALELVISGRGEQVITMLETALKDECREANPLNHRGLLASGEIV